MKLCVVVLLSLAALSSAHILSDDEYGSLFELWTKTHSKAYADATEYAYRLEVFKNNYDYILRHNLLKNATFSLRMNKFGDLPNAEFRRMYARMDPSWKPVFLPRREVTLPADSLPAAVNWTAKGKTTPPQNQGQCGSCWAISTAEAISSAHAIKFNQDPIVLSAQELVDCVEDNQGCNGGSLDNTYAWVEKNGICSEASYPYQGETGQCMSSKCKPVYNISGYVDIPANNEKQVQAALATVPVNVVVDAQSTEWQFYSSGVLTQSDCGTEICHSLLATGYGELNGVEYYSNLNSWGSDWGMNGYILIARNVKDPAGECGIAMMPSYAIA